MNEEIKVHPAEDTDENTSDAYPKQTEDELWVEDRNTKIEETKVSQEVKEPEKETMAVPLFEGKKAEEFRGMWQDVQADFVDDPRNSVVKADALVAKVIKNIEDSFASERSSLENQWNQGKDVSTEDLRVMLKRYRSFFDRLLTLKP